MDCGGFLIKGSRPPSATSNQQQNSAHGKHHGYHTVSRTSFTDESLFGSVHQTKINEPMEGHFKAPWEYPKPLTPGHTYSSVQRYKAVLASKKEKQKDRPLLWCPTPGSSKFTKSKTGLNGTNLNSGDFDCHWNTRTHFRHLKHTPTFIDESLFGKKLEEPTFEAPWNHKITKDPSVMYQKPYLWDSSGDFRIQSHNGVEIDIHGRPSSLKRRPKTAIGMSQRKEKEHCQSRPLWKP